MSPFGPQATLVLNMRSGTLPAWPLCSSHHVAHNVSLVHLVNNLVKHLSFPSQRFGNTYGY